MSTPPPAERSGSPISPPPADGSCEVCGHVSTASGPAGADGREDVDPLLHLTGARDCEALGERLIELLAELPSTHATSIFEAYGTVDRAEVGGEEAPVLRRLPSRCAPSPGLPDLRGVSEALVARAERVVEDARGHRVVSPVFCSGGPPRIVVLDCHATPAEAEQAFRRRLLALYRNQLSLIDAMERDRLTGLLNRHAFDERFFQLEHDAEGGSARLIGSAWLAVLDVDHFKQVNDVHGHLVGDEVLLLLAQLMKREFRYSDLLFRFGGEEFVVILRGVPESGARLALERLRVRVEEHDFPRIARLTVSIGFTEVAKGAPPDRIVDLADRALYRAKASGRNRIVSSDELPDTERAGFEGAVELF